MSIKLESSEIRLVLRCLEAKQTHYKTITNENSGSVFYGQLIRKLQKITEILEEELKCLQ